MNTFFGQTFVCLIVMLKNKTRAIEDINISIALVDSWVRPLIGQCKLNDIVRWVSAPFLYFCIRSHFKNPIFVLPTIKNNKTEKDRVAI